MKFTLVLIVACFQVSASSLAQNISLSEKNTPLRVIFEAINRQTGYEFICDSELLAQASPVDIVVTNASLEEVLAICFERQPLTYVISDKIIVVKRLPVEAVEIVVKTRITITGNVKDESGGVMPGVSVIVKGTSSGTATNEIGDYSIELPGILSKAEESGGEALVFTFIGYKPIEEEINNRSVIDVVMREDPTILNTVQITGTNYFSMTKERSTMNIAKVNAKDVEKQPVTNPLMALQGRMAGVDVTPYNGVPGAAIKIQIRGVNNLNTNGNKPLYVIDGVPVESSALQSSSGSLLLRGVDPLSTLDPTNIESFEVLKDGASTAIYGSQGANGVVRITTKKGKEAKKTSLDVSFYTGLGEMTHKLDLLNTSQFMKMKHEAYANDGITTPVHNDFVMNGIWDSTRYTDWQEVLLGGTSHINSLSAALSGGNGKTSFRAGGSYRTESAIYPGEAGFRNITGNLSVDHVSPNEKFKVSFSTNYGSNRIKTYESRNFEQDAYTLPPNAPALYKENGELNWQESEEYGGETWTNPMSYLLNTHNVEVQNMITNGVLSYEILPGLAIKSNMGFTVTVGRDLIKHPIAALSPSSIASGEKGSLITSSNARSSWILEPQLSYTRKIKDHDFDVMIGGSWKESMNAYKTIVAGGYTSDALLNSMAGATSIRVDNDEQSQYHYCAFFGRLGYSLKDKYLLDITGRRDGSSRFGPGNKFATFWGVGAGWIFSKEKFFSGNDNEYPERSQEGSILSFGKLRGSYAITGNDQIPDYGYLDTYDVSKQFYQGQITFYPTALFNPDFAWEETRKLEFALELGFINDRLTVEPSWYRNISSNQLISYRLPATTGFDAVRSNFDAVIENTGWEVVLNSINIRNQVFKWNTSVNLTFPRNKLLKFDNLENTPYAISYKVGEPLIMARVYKWLGVNPLTGLHEVRDMDDNGIYDENDKVRRFIGRKYYGGITNAFVFKSFEFSFHFYFAVQTTPLPHPYVPGSYSNQPTEVLQRWRNEGDITDYQRFTTALDVNSLEASSAFRRVSESDYAIKNSSFIRLKTVSFSYTVPVKKIGLQSARIYMQGQNLFTLTKLVAFDPETGVLLPPLRIVTLGVDFRL